MRFSTSEDESQAQLGQSQALVRMSVRPQGRESGHSDDRVMWFREGESGLHEDRVRLQKGQSEAVQR